MLAEINLLPKKERKSFAFPIASALIVLVLAGVGGFFFYTYTQTKKDIVALESNLAQTRQLIEIETTKAETTVNSVTQLEKMIEWGETYTIKSVPILDELISLLPQRGFFMQYDYKEQNTVELTVRFDASLEASSYLDELLASEWTSEAKLNSLDVTESYHYYEINGYGEPEKPEFQLLNEDFVPRYEAVYEIKLASDFILNKQNEDTDSSSSQEGEDDVE